MTAARYSLPDHSRKVCELLRFLAGHEVLGLAPGEIAKGIGVSPSWVSRTLPAMEAETGFVERVADTGRWRLGVPLVRIATTVQTNLQTEFERLQQTGRRYSVPV